MKFVCQSLAIEELQILANSHRHSVLLEGPAGCGKTYLAKMYADMLGISDFQVVPATVQDVKSAVDQCLNLETPVVLCIENLDSGVPAASYALLKFLEEPTESAYIVVTCTSSKLVPDTIVSRSATVVAASPTDSDIAQYMQTHHTAQYATLQNTRLWKCVKSFSDCNVVARMSKEHIQYFDTLPELMKFKDTISNMMWNLGNFPDKVETPLNLVLNYIIAFAPSRYVRYKCIECAKEVQKHRIATHAILAKFLFEVKYCE